MSKKLSLITLLCFIVGAIFGLVFPTISPLIAFIGTIYTNLLKIMIVPVLSCSIIAALANKEANSSKITIKAIVLFVVMFCLSFLVCLGLWAIIKPGVNFLFDNVVWEGEAISASIQDFFLNIFPSNIIEAASNNSILPVIIFAFVFGLIANKIKSESVNKVIIDLSKIFNEMLRYVMYLTPTGVFALVANTSSVFGSKIVGATATYVCCAYLGCLVVALLIMILPVWIICKIDPLTYIKKVYKVWLITLSTCSSAATLPCTIKTCNEEFGIPDRITNIVVPLGCTIHMCGGAVSFSLLAMLNLQLFGVPVTFGLVLIMLLLALLLNMGAPGIPGGGVVIGASYLSAIGLPLTFIGFYAGIYRVLDMAYTTMNVCGDITANLIINHYENNK